MNGLLSVDRLASWRRRTTRKPNAFTSGFRMVLNGGTRLVPAKYGMSLRHLANLVVSTSTRFWTTNRTDGTQANNSMQQTARRAAVDAERCTVTIGGIPAVACLLFHKSLRYPGIQAGPHPFNSSPPVTAPHPRMPRTPGRRCARRRGRSMP